MNELNGDFLGTLYDGARRLGVMDAERSSTEDIFACNTEDVFVCNNEDAMYGTVATLVSIINAKGRLLPSDPSLIAKVFENATSKAADGDPMNMMITIAIMCGFASGYQKKAKEIKDLCFPYKSSPAESL